MLNSYEMSETTKMYVDSIGQCKQYLLSHIEQLLTRKEFFEDNAFPAKQQVIVGQDGTAYVIDMLGESVITYHVQAIFGSKWLGESPHTLTNLVFFLRLDEIKFKE